MFLNSINGIKASIELLNKSAYEAQKGIEGDLVESQVDAIQAKHMMTANVAVLKTADEMYKSLIDILA